MKWIIEAIHEGLTIREYLQQIQAFSRSMIKAVIHDGGEICVNDLPKTVRCFLQEDDELSVVFPVEKKGPFMVPEEMSLSIIYEDKDVLILNKPAGIATIPSNLHPSGTIANGVIAHYEKHDIPYTFHVVTRLDKDTSGLLLIAKHRYSHSILARSQKASKVNRKYVAIIEGHLADKKGTIHAPIDRKDGSIIERTVSDSGKAAVTHYSVQQESAAHTLVDVLLATGRTHQIRVHFSYTGHPLAGDDLYGGSTELISRQALHCYHIAFQHPVTAKMMNFSTPTADDMMQLV